MRKLLFIAFLFCYSAAFSQTSGYFTYTMFADSKTAAGIYDASNNLVRQVWSAKLEKAWDPYRLVGWAGCFRKCSNRRALYLQSFKL